MTTTYFRADFKHGTVYRGSKSFAFQFASHLKLNGRVSWHSNRRNVPASNSLVEVVPAVVADAKVAKIAMERAYLLREISLTESRIKAANREIDRKMAPDYVAPPYASSAESVIAYRDRLATSLEVERARLAKHIDKHGEL